MPLFSNQEFVFVAIFRYIKVLIFVHNHYFESVFRNVLNQRKTSDMKNVVPHVFCRVKWRYCEPHIRYIHRQNLFSKELPLFHARSNFLLP